MPQPQTIEEFVARHSQSTFRHKDQLFSLLASGAATCETNASLVTCEQLLNIYRRRADHLRTYDTPHARQLREDVLALCDALAAATDDHCRLWNFSSPPNCDYAIFEGAETGRILGCVFAKDKRLTPPDELDKLWRETKAANHDAPNKSLDASGGSEAAKSKGPRAKRLNSRRRVNSNVWMPQFMK